MNSKNNISERLHRLSICIGDSDAELLLKCLNNLHVCERIKIPEERQLL